MSNFPPMSQVEDEVIIHCPDCGQFLFDQCTQAYLTTCLNCGWPTDSAPMIATTDPRLLRVTLANLGPNDPITPPLEPAEEPPTTPQTGGNTAILITECACCNTEQPCFDDGEAYICLDRTACKARYTAADPLTPDERRQLDEEILAINVRPASGYFLSCTICGGPHRPTQCPEVAAEKARQAREESAGRGIARQARHDRARFLRCVARVGDSDRLAMAGALAGYLSGRTDLFTSAPISVERILAFWASEQALSDY